MKNFFEGDPATIKGGLGWVALAAIGAMLALLASQLAPSIIPARASQSSL